MDLRYKLPDHVNLSILRGGCGELFDAYGVDVERISTIANVPFNDYAFDLRRDIIEFIASQRWHRFFVLNIMLIMLSTMLVVLTANSPLLELAIHITICLFLILEVVIVKEVWSDRSLRYLPHDMETMQSLSNSLLASCMESGTPEQQQADLLGKVLPRSAPGHQGSCLQSLELFMSGRTQLTVKSARIPMLKRLAVLHMLSNLSNSDEVHAAKADSNDALQGEELAGLPTVRRVRKAQGKAGPTVG